MVTVGIREFKSKLSEYLRLVRAGETVVVTDRGEPVAEVRSPGATDGPTEYPHLNELIRMGHVRVAEPNAPQDLYHIPHRPKLHNMTSQELLDASREEG